MQIYQDIYQKIQDHRRFEHISGIFTYVICHLAENGIDDVEEDKKGFIEVLKIFLERKEAIIVFNPTVVDEEKKRELDNADMQTQLDFIYASFPTEYDENIIEKDIYDLWWYCCCPVEIGWRREDGTYYFG